MGGSIVPFGLTCQQFGMVWDGENDVGIEQITFFLYIVICSVQFCNLFIGDFGRLPLGPILGVPHRLAGAQQERLHALATRWWVQH